jgi:hypothetical protein
MRKTLLSVVLAGLAWIQLNAQEERFGPCTRAIGWEDISVVRKTPSGEGAGILLITNRPYRPDDPEGIWFPNELADFRKVTYLVATCSQGDWTLNQVEGFEEGMAAVNHGEDILLFVHGHGKSMPSVLTRASRIRDKYGVTVVVFDWPSMNMNFNTSLSRVRRCGENFYNLLLQFDRYREQMQVGQSLTLMLHSLGNYFITHLVVNGNNQYLDRPIFDNIIMNSAAVRSREHGKVLSQIRFTRRLYVVINRNDRVLRGAQLLTSGRMLGNEVMKPLASGAVYVDFTCVAGTEHTYFTGYNDFEYSQPAIGYFFDEAIHGRKVDFRDRTLFTAGSSPDIWIVRDPATGCPE